MRRRMPLVIEFELPTATERAAILRTLVRDDELGAPDGLVRTALLAEGFSGSDLENVYREACMARVTALVEGTRTDRRLLDGDLDAGLDATARSMDAHAINHLMMRAAPAVPPRAATATATATA
jgi:SpoVK/Ycf46/Vps4 family AAA+-type ATPase